MESEMAEPKAKQKVADDGVDRAAARSSRDVNARRPVDEVLTWDEFFMGAAFLASLRSKDPVTRVGACIVNADRKIVGTGYNGMPNGCSDRDFSWHKETNDVSNMKSTYVCHAEMNAVLNTNSADIKGCTMYVGLFPCNQCAKLIIQAGIKKVIYYSDKQSRKRKHRQTNEAAKNMFESAGVVTEPFDRDESRTKIVIDFSEIERD